MNKYIKAFNALTNNITADEFIDNIDEIYDKFVKCCPLDEDGDKMTHTEFINITFDANRGIISLRLTYGGKKTSLREAIGEQVEVKFESYDDDPDDVKARNAEVVDVENSPIVTFLPTDGKAAYTVAHTDGNGVSYTLEKETQQSVSISITHESKSYISVDLTDNGEDDMKFFAWQRVENYGTVNEQISYLSYDEDFTYHFENVEDEIHIRAEFIPTSWAEYIIKSEPEVKYFDFQKAINVAELGSNDDEKIVVVLNHSDKDSVLEFVMADGVEIEEVLSWANLIHAELFIIEVLDCAIFIEIEVFCTYAAAALTSRSTVKGVTSVMIYIIPLPFELDHRRMYRKTMVG